MPRSGSADLPLHGGRVPEWLASRMARLGRIIVEALLIHEGPHGVLRRLAHPFWFQSLGAVMGMDWHSSGITTSVLGALRRGLAGSEDELGLWVCGGRGARSRETPGQLIAIGGRTGLDGAALAQTSRLVAKVDSAAVQDGFQLYLHGFVLARDGSWTVVQQGMQPDTKTARRYHWLSETVSSFVDEPHAAIEGRPGAPIVNLTDRRAAASRLAQVELVGGGPDAIVRELRRLRDASTSVPTQSRLRHDTIRPGLLTLPHLSLPHHHEVTGDDVVLRRLHGSLAAAADRGPKDFQELLMTPGLGARTLRALALVAEVVHGAPCRFTDPARFSMAHGGKDGHPFPVPLRVYDKTIAVMKAAVAAAKLGNDERLSALRRLDEQARLLERTARGPTVDELIAAERAESHRYGGMTVLGPARAGRPAPAQPPSPRSSAIGGPVASDRLETRKAAPGAAQLSFRLPSQRRSSVPAAKAAEPGQAGAARVRATRP